MCKYRHARITTTAASASTTEHKSIDLERRKRWLKKQRKREKLLKYLCMMWIIESEWSKREKGDEIHNLSNFSLLPRRIAKMKINNGNSFAHPNRFSLTSLLQMHTLSLCSRSLYSRFLSLFLLPYSARINPIDVMNFITSRENTIQYHLSKNRKQTRNNQMKLVYAKHLGSGLSCVRPLNSNSSRSSNSNGNRSNNLTCYRSLHLDIECIQI